VSGGRLTLDFTATAGEAVVSNIKIIRSFEPRTGAGVENMLDAQEAAATIKRVADIPSNLGGYSRPQVPTRDYPNTADFRILFQGLKHIQEQAQRNELIA